MKYGVFAVTVDAIEIGPFELIGAIGDPLLAMVSGVDAMDNPVLGNPDTVAVML
jgi:hypothetical protein